MKRRLQKILVLLAIALVPLSLKAQLSVVIDEGFESGIPTDWTQEQVVGDFTWTAENQDLIHPEGAYQGTGRALFRNSSNQTRHYVSRLISPVMKLANVYQPILCFAHAQDKWTNDFDVLRIYYRSSKEAEWVLLKEYDYYIPDWRLDTIALVGVTDEYQVAFEGYDNLGRGIVLDNVKVRSMPNCLQPYNLGVSNLTNFSATLTWAGSFDSETFHVKVSSTALTDADLHNAAAKADVTDSLVSGELYELNIDGLEAGVQYHYYVKANCPGEEGEWSEVHLFRTTNTVELPYFQPFNMEYTPGYLHRMSDWYYGTSTDDFCPFVNTGSESSDRLKYSPDTTTALCFSGGNSLSNAIDPAQWAYAATPMLMVDKLSDVQVSFVSTIYFLRDEGEYNRLIVGAMTDPTDFNSFYPIDTVEVNDRQVFEKFIISFENYTGSAKHVALVSNFVHANSFYIDNFEVTIRPECPKAQFKYRLLSATELEVVCKDGKYGCEVYVADAELDVTNMDMSHVVAQHSSAGSVCKVGGLTPWAQYYVYVRMKCADGYGEWSDCKLVRMPQKAAQMPYLVDFEIKSNDPATYYTPMPWSTNKLALGLLVKTTAGGPPQSSDIYWRSWSESSTSVKALSPFELMMSVSEMGQSSYVIFPEVDRLQNKQVGFYVGNHSTSYPSVHFTVGIMSDANDTATFVPVDTFQTSIQYVYHTMDFSSYTGNGKFVAVRLVYDKDIDDSQYLWIDNWQFDDIPTCTAPTDIMVDPLYDGAEVEWQSQGPDEWHVLVLDRAILMDSIYSLTDDLLFASPADYGVAYVDTVQTASATIHGLYPEKNKYHLYIRSVCNGVPGKWMGGLEFETACADKEPLPYVMNFDTKSNGEPYRAGSTIPQWAVPCVYTVLDSYYYSGGGHGSTNYYPYLSTSKAFSGTQSLYLTYSKNQYDSYVAFPQIDIDDFTDLELTFYMTTGDDTYELEVGVMTDPLDTATFELVQTVVPEVENEFAEYIVPMFNYKGAGKYIAMRPSHKKTIFGVYIDSVVIDVKASCVKVQKPRAVSTTDVSASLTWNGYDETEWRLVVAKEMLSLDQLDAAAVDENIEFADNVTSRPYTINGLSSNALYYIYVKAICSPTESGRWSSAGKFRTDCQILDAGKLGVESFETYGVGNEKYPICYVVGNRSNDRPIWTTPHCVAVYSHTGSNCLEVSSTIADNGAYAITSKLDVDSISRLRVHFWASAKGKATNQYEHRLTVGVITDPTDLASFVPVDTLDLFDGEARYEVRFDSYQGDYNDDFGKYVMFYSEFDKNNTAYIDDVWFDTIPECVSPKINIGSLTSDGCSVSIEGGKMPYTILVSDHQLSENSLDNYSPSFSEDGVVKYEVSAVSYSVTGLNPATEYFLYAASDCGEGSELSNMYVFRTECLEKASLPFEDNFEQNEKTGMHNNPLCWVSYYNRAGKETQYPYVYKDSKASKAVYVYASSGSEGSYLVSPELDVTSLSECQISFYAKSNSAKNTTSRAIIVGFANSECIDSIMAFEPYDTIVISGSDEYEKHTINFSSYSGIAKRVVLTASYDLNRSSATSTSGALGGYYVDDVVIEKIPTCPRPDFFSLKKISDSSITLSFTNHSSATEFEAMYGVAGFDVNGTDGTLVSVSNTEFTIQGLTAQTTYDIYVRAVCASTDKSLWAYAGVYTTTAVVENSFPYNGDFEDDTSGWSLVSGSTNPNKWYIGSAYPKDGDKSMYISKDSGASATYQGVEEKGVKALSYSWAYKPFMLTEGVYEVAFDWTCYGEGTFDYMRAGLLPATSVFEGGADKITSQDGTVVSFNANASSNPAEWIELSNDAKTPKLNMVDTTKTASEQWVHNSKLVVVRKDQAGVYNLVFYWKNDASGAKHPTPSAVIDNITIKKESCAMPVDFKIEDISDVRVSLKWSVAGNTPDGYNVMVYTEPVSMDTATEAGSVFAANNINAASCTIDNLAPQTSYYVYVQSVCGSTPGFWSEPFKFTTPCSLVQGNVLYDFDNEDEHWFKVYANGSTQKSYRTPDCFDTYSADMEYTSSNASSFPYCYKNTTTSQYSRSGNYCLYFKATKAEQMGAYIVLPMFEGNLAEKQLSFWMRGVYHSISGVNKNKLQGTSYVGSDYTRSVAVGTMTDPNDTSTFKLLQVVTYPFTQKDLSTSMTILEDPLGENFWRQVVIPLDKAEGRYIALRNDVVGNAVKSYLYIDDILVTEQSNCPMPYNVKVSDVKATSAYPSFEAADGISRVAMLSLTPDFTDTLRMDTISGQSFRFDGLRSATTYYVKVKQICADAMGESDWTSPEVFVTDNTIRFMQDFSESIRCPEDWSRATSPKAEDIFKGTKRFSFSGPQVSAGFTREDALFADGLFATPHMSTSISGTDGTEWLFTPAVSLPENARLHLTFDVSLTDRGSNTAPIGDDLLNDDDKFMVIVSTDKGETYKAEDAVVWSNDGLGDYELNKLPNTGKRYTLDISKYAGKSIKVAFYVESTVSNATVELHIDNVLINTLVEESVADNICQLEDYNSRLFHITADNMKVGDNMFEKIIFASRNTSDTLYRFNLHVRPMTETIFEDHICEGYLYDKHGFNVDREGVYRLKYRAANGCDSIVTLNLTTEPTRRTTVMDTICQGSTYIFNYKEYTRTGAYSDTLVSAVTKCDSIVTLLLKVNEAIRFDEKKTLCYGESYEFGGLGLLSESGTYVDTFKTAADCDSIVTLTLNILPNFSDTIKATICEGDTYDENGFNGITKSGTYVLPLTSANGCDSTLTLMLTVLSGDTTRVEFTITTDQLPYEYETIRYEVGTATGVYIDTINISTDKCDNVIIHKLTINEVVGVDNVPYVTLNIVPNPVSTMQAILVYADALAETYGDITLKVFDAAGRMVYATKSESYPINIPGLNQAGVYIIRIITETGDVYQGKVMVK